MSPVGVSGTQKRLLFSSFGSVRSSVSIESGMPSLSVSSSAPSSNDELERFFGRHFWAGRHSGTRAADDADDGGSRSLLERVGEDDVALLEEHAPRRLPLARHEDVLAIKHNLNQPQFQKVLRLLLIFHQDIYP